MREKGVRRKALRAAFPHTIPILAGFWFLGMAHGIIMAQKGFNFLYSLLMAVVVFGGSLEYVAVELLLSAFAPIQALVTALLVQARHLFYGISMLDKYKGMGWKRIYLIFGMCDESFSINYTADIPRDVDRGWFMFFVTMLDQIYWVTANITGGLLGSVISFDIKGLDFVMTAMFVVIFLEQWRKDKKHYTALIGLAASVACLVIFGPETFLLPTMASILLLLTVFRRPIEGLGGRGGMKPWQQAAALAVLAGGIAAVRLFVPFFNAASQAGAAQTGMTLAQRLITIAILAVGTMSTRFLPFLVFRDSKPTPKYVQYLGKALPAAIFGMLVVYCLKSVNILAYSYGLPELIAILATLGLHLWKGQMILSIAGGTACYMLLVQMVFLA